MDGKKEVTPEDVYLLFYGNCFYPLGGWDDCKGCFSSAQEAKDYLSKKEPDSRFMWAHIVHKGRMIHWGCSFDDPSKEKQQWEWGDKEW